MVLYFIKSTFLLLIFCLIYKWNLENKKSLQFIRYYLLTSIFFALVVPLFSFQFLVPQNKIVETKEYIFDQLPDFPVTIINNVPQNNISTLTIIYVFVSGVFLIRFLYNLFKILQIKKSGKKISTSFGKLIVSNKVKSPFTFCNYIYVNKTEWESKSVSDAILYHEQAHVKQNHSIDVLFIEVLKIVMWFQPFLYYFKRIVQENHEYLADEFSLQRTNDLKNYQELILNYYGNNQPIVALSSSIHFNNLKKRFIMMKNTNKGKVWGTIFYSLTVALTYVGFVGIEAKASDIKKIENKISNVVEESVKQPEKMVDSLLTSDSDIDKKDDKIPVLKYIVGKQNSGYMVNPADEKIYYYIVSAEKEVSIYNRYGVLQETKNFKFKLEEMSVAENETYKKDQEKRFESLTNNKENEPIVFEYIQGVNNGGVFKDYTTGKVLSYIVLDDKTVVIVDSSGAKVDSDKFSYILKEIPNHGLNEKGLNNQSQPPLSFVEKKAMPREGLASFMQNFAREFKAPENINADEIKMRLKFIVETDGSFSNILTPQEYFKPDESYLALQEEAVRTLKTMPEWKPAEHEGQVVRSTFTLPITIRVNPNIDVVN